MLAGSSRRGPSSVAQSAKSRRLIQKRRNTELRVDVNLCATHFKARLNSIVIDKFRGLPGPTSGTSYRYLQISRLFIICWRCLSRIAQFTKEAVNKMHPEVSLLQIREMHIFCFSHWLVTWRHFCKQHWLPPSAARVSGRGWCYFPSHRGHLSALLNVKQ